MKENEIEINNKIYVLKSSIKETNEHKGHIKIVILQRGWIYIGKFLKKGNKCSLFNSYCIRNWGTTKGLQELVNGKTDKTILDKCEGIVEFDWLTVIHTIDVNQEVWSKII